MAGNDIHSVNFFKLQHRDNYLTSLIMSSPEAMPEQQLETLSVVPIAN